MSARARPWLAFAAAGALLFAGVLADDIHQRLSLGSAQHQVGSLQGHASSLAQELAVSRARATEDLALYQRDEYLLLHPEITKPDLLTWTDCGGPCSVGPGAVRVESVPDTFRVHIKFTATVPVTAYILGFDQWAEYDFCGFSTSCVAGSYKTFGPATSMDQQFSDATGCSGYVLVLAATKAGTISPEFSAQYDPASHITGICAAG